MTRHCERRENISGAGSCSPEAGAGKAAVLELLRHSLCDDVAILSEAVGIIFGSAVEARRIGGQYRAAVGPLAERIFAQLDDQARIWLRVSRDEGRCLARFDARASP